MSVKTSVFWNYLEMLDDVAGRARTKLAKIDLWISGSHHHHHHHRYIYLTLLGLQLKGTSASSVALSKVSRRPRSASAQLSISWVRASISLSFLPEALHRWIVQSVCRFVLATCDPHLLIMTWSEKLALQSSEASNSSQAAPRCRLRCLWWPANNNVNPYDFNFSVRNGCLILKRSQVFFLIFQDATPVFSFSAAPCFRPHPPPGITSWLSSQFMSIYYASVPPSCAWALPFSLPPSLLGLSGVGCCSPTQCLAASKPKAIHKIVQSLLTKTCFLQTESRTLFQPRCHPRWGSPLHSQHRSHSHPHSLKPPPPCHRPSPAAGLPFVGTRDGPGPFVPCTFAGRVPGPDFRSPLRLRTFRKYRTFQPMCEHNPKSLAKTESEHLHWS